MKARLLELLGIAVLLLAAACHPGEGERCNPLRYTDDCPSGTSCTYPPSCGVAFCCPPVVTSSTSSNCRPCPASDGGATD